MDFINEDGTFADGWHNSESLPEGVRGEKSLESIRDFPSAIKSLVNAQKMVGAEKIALPGKYATDEDWNNVYAKLGRPEKPDAYTFKKPDNFPPVFDYIEGMEKGYKEVAHKLGLSNKQAENLYGWYMDFTLGEAKNLANGEKKTMEEAIVSLGPDKDKIFDKSNKIIDTVLSNKEVNEALKEHLDNHSAGPAIRTILAAMFDRTMEDKTRDLGTGGGGYMDPKQELNAIMAQTKDPKSAFMDAAHPQHKDMMEKVKKLNEQIYGKDAV